MNLSEIQIIEEDEMFRGSKSRYVWFFGGIFILLCFLVMHYSIYVPFLFQNFRGIPYTLISYLVVLFIGPFMVMITSFDSVSSEIETGSIRYVISKVHRSSFILGKFLFLFLVSISVSSVIALISLIQQYSVGNAFQFENTGLFWIFSNLYLGCFISIFLLISTLSDNNKISFTVSAIFLGILIFFYLKGDSNYLKFLTPFYYGANNIDFMTDFSFKAEYLRILESLFSMLLYISVYLSMSLVAIKRRDL
jgi:ABC-2 type transport system permease protein